MFKPADMNLWSGRDDGHGKERWHQQISPRQESSPAGIALLGVACDEGIKRNYGRTGAVEGPDAIRQALVNLAYRENTPLYDAGNICCDRGSLEDLQNVQAAEIFHLLEQNHFPLVIGGGHEIAYGSFAGLEKFLSQDKKSDPIGIINLDAHFDLRHAEQATSGTPFLQIATHCQQKVIPFHYLCLGINDTANTETLFTTAEQLKVQYLRDEELNCWQFKQVKLQLKNFMSPCQAIYLSVDLDVLPAATAPGVSAPAARGVPLDILEWLIATIKQIAGQRLKLADIAEYNPKYDIDGRTARVAARLCHLLIRKEES